MSLSDNFYLNERYLQKPEEHLSIILPPPNVTGKLHLGHYFDHVIPDLFAKAFIIGGKKVLWVPSLDHAGIATENVIRKKYGRIDQELIDKEIKANSKYILDQLADSNISLSFDQPHLFTLDDDFSAAVIECIQKLWKKDLLFFDFYITNWCFNCQTVLSDEETTKISKQQSMFEIKYAIDGDSGNFVTVSTTRPETIFADICLISRHNTGIKNVLIPLCNKSIPVIEFSNAFNKDIETDFIKITPSLSKIDFAIAKKLEIKFDNEILFDEYGKCTLEEYKGKSISETRRLVVEKLRQQDLIVAEHAHISEVPACYRCQREIDHKISKQLFVNLSKILKTIKYEGVFRRNSICNLCDAWIKKVDRWCISRQISLGHKIPLFYCSICDKTNIEPVCCCNQIMTQIPGVLDTWFSSALTGVVLNKKYGKQQHLLFCGSDILFFWIIKMLALDETMLGHASVKSIRFHGLLRDNVGRKLSKSLNNSPDLQILKTQIGLDALRYFFYNHNISSIESINFSADIASKEYSKIDKKLDNIKILLDSSNISNEDSITEKVFFHYVAYNFWHIMNDLLFYEQIKTATEKVNNLLFDLFSREYLEIRKSRFTSLTLKSFRLMVELLYPFIPQKALSLFPDLLDPTKLVNTKISRHCININRDYIFAYKHFCRVVNLLKHLKNLGLSKENIYIFVQKGSLLSKIIQDNLSLINSLSCSKDPVSHHRYKSCFYLEKQLYIAIPTNNKYKSNVLYYNWFDFIYISKCEKSFHTQYSYDKINLEARIKDDLRNRELNDDSNSKIKK